MHRSFPLESGEWEPFRGTLTGFDPETATYTVEFEDEVWDGSRVHSSNTYQNDFIYDDDDARSRILVLNVRVIACRTAPKCDVDHA